MRRFVPLAAALSLAVACGPAAVVAPPAAPTTPTSAAVAAKPAPTPPAKITAGAMPADVQVYVEIGGISPLIAAIRSTISEVVYGEARAAAAKELGVSEKTVEQFLTSIESIHLGGKRAGDDVKAAVSVVFSDAAPIRDLVTAGLLTEAGPVGAHGRRLKPKDAKDSKDTLIWFEGPRLLVLGDDPMVESITASVEGRAPMLTNAQRNTLAPAPGERRVADAFIAPALLDDITAGKVSLAGPVAAAFGIWDGGLRGSYRAAIAAQNLKASLPIPSPRALDLARRLPADTTGYLALSTGLPGGRKGALQLLGHLSALDRDVAQGLAGADAILQETGLGVADILGGLGNEAVLAAVVKPGAKTKEEIEKGYAAVYLQEVNDEKAFARLLKAARDKLADAQKAKKKLKMRPDGTGFTVDLTGAPLPYLRVKLDKGRLFLGVGPKDIVERAAAAIDKGKGTLGEDGAHARALGVLPPSAQARLWIDFGRVLELAAKEAPKAPPAELVNKLALGPKRITSALSFSAIPEDDRVRFELDEVNGIGAFAAIGIYGVRRYLARAKEVEAKNSLSALSYAVVAASEREQLGPNNTLIHKPCRSAIPVPAAVPRAKKYMPSGEPGKDWNSGDRDTGWTCLRFAMTEPQYYQYTYVVGGPYKGPKRGGPDPGPNGYEIAAEGDLDGDGVTSLFTRVGKIDPQTALAGPASEIWIDKEDE